MCLINNSLDDFSKPLPFFSVWRQCMLRVRLFKWGGGVWRRMCFCPDLVFSSSGSSLFTVRYLQGVLRAQDNVFGSGKSFSVEVNTLG